MKKAVIFDLDGVLVTTDECHFQAWKKMADQEGIPFDREDNQRLRGVSRMESLEIILEKSDKTYTNSEKQALADRKNAYYVKLISKITPDAILPGALETLSRLREAGINMAIGSSSRNAPAILERLGLRHWFDAVADGNQIVNSKPDPEVFLLAADLMGINPKYCLVIEDADAGVEAALAAGMAVLAVGAAKNHPMANLRAQTLADIDVTGWMQQNLG